MMYEQLKETLFSLLKVPRGEPDPPAGSRESVRIFRAAPNFLKFRLIIMAVVFGLVFFFGLLLLLAGAISGESAPVIITVLIFLVALAALPVTYFLIRIDYDLRYYIVTDRSLRIRQGALVIEEGTFTYANVQNLKIHQGPVERFLGISNLVVQTAGGSSPAAKGEPTSSLFHRGVLRGISNAVEVRDLILSLLKKYRDAGLGDPEERGRDGLGGTGIPGGLSETALKRLREIRGEIRLLGEVLRSR